jgi:hypothetical protein
VGWQKRLLEGKNNIIVPSFVFQAIAKTLRLFNTNTAIIVHAQQVHCLREDAFGRFALSDGGV